MHVCTAHMDREVSHTEDRVAFGVAYFESAALTTAIKVLTDIAILRTRIACIVEGLDLAPQKRLG
jgi:hypothetical protein